MSVPAIAPLCGFDIGTENCYIGIARQGGIEIILNDFSQRSTPGYVYLCDNQRELGVAAKQKQNTNINFTYYNLRRLIGRQFHEVVNEENLAFPIEQAENGEIAVRVYIQNEEHVLNATQLLAMVLTKLKQLSNNALECVINCPNYFTDSQRRALKHAATIANINTLRILPDLSAIALYYCFYRVNSKEENNQILVFIDVGASSTQCSIVNFDPKKFTIQVLAVEYESNLGGRNFDEIIANYFIQQKNLRLNKRSKTRLLVECEKLKKQMSANRNELPINIECLYEDTDFSGKMDRSLFENLCQEKFNKIESTLRRVLSSAVSNYSKSQQDGDKSQDLKFSTIEIVGGSSRIPAIKRAVKNVFGIEPSSTLNADEAVALGCTLQTALLSPNFRVARELHIIDYQPYQINCRYWHENENEGKVHIISPFFKRGSAIPFTRQIMFNCHSLPIIFELDYLNESNQSTSIGQFKIYSSENIKYPQCKMKIQVRIDNSGLVGITTTCLLIEELKEEQEKGKEEEKGKEQEKDEKPKTELKTVKLDVQTNWIRGNIDDATLDAYKTLEFNLVLADKNLNEKLDARNELEEYIYEWRDKIENEGYQKYIDANSKFDFINNLKMTEKWLYEETEEVKSKSAYQELLTELKTKYSDGIMFRLRENESRGAFLEKLGKFIQMGHELLQTQEQVEDLEDFKKKFIDTHQYFEDAQLKLANLDLSRDPPLTTDKIKQKINEFDQEIKNMIDKIQKCKKAKEEALMKTEEKMETKNEQNGKIKQEDKQETTETAKMDIDN